MIEKKVKVVKEIRKVIKKMNLNYKNNKINHNKKKRIKVIIKINKK